MTILRHYDLAMANNQEDYSVKVLTDAVQATVCALRVDPSDGRSLGQKRELDHALRVLDWARALSITGRERYVVVPLGKTKTPSSEFRVVEDNESDDRMLWTEVEIDGDRIRLYPGDVIVRK